MALDPKSAVILIPSLEPDDRLPAYLKQLKERGFERLVVVDDGSSEKTQHLFDQMAQMEGVTVLHHDVNHGKGVALKTGYAWIRDNLPDITGVNPPEFDHDATGVFWGIRASHVAFDFAAAIMQEAGLSCRVLPCTSDEYAAAHPESARRPAWSALENRMLRCTVGDSTRDWRDALKDFFANWNGE